MALKKITDYTAASTPLTGAELFEADVSGVPKKVTADNLAARAIASDIEIAALAGLTSAANKLPYFTGSGTAALADFTLAGRELVGSTSTGQAGLLSGVSKSVASIADATITTVYTVTIPNASHSASIRVKLVGKIGAGGAIGAGEATGTIEYDIAIARTAGVNAVAGISAAFGSTTAAVAGATTITVAGTLGAVAGAVGASNTIDIRVTITKGGGASANHTCLAYAEVLNANATGVTVA